MKRAVTFGTFDVFHYGHLKILQRASEYADELIVGISSDNLNFSKKGRKPIYSEDQRMKIISSLDFVDGVFLEESLELKGEYLEEYNADVLIMGDDWAGKFDEFNNICEVQYLPRTPNISTTQLIERIKNI
jgi:glycerol-3-phosphate cytidylyltransferase